MILFCVRCEVLGVIKCLSLFSDISEIFHGQRGFSGSGCKWNYYACETMFLAGLKSHKVLGFQISDRVAMVIPHCLM